MVSTSCLFMSRPVARLVRHGSLAAALTAAIVVLPAWTAAARGPRTSLMSLNK